MSEGPISSGVVKMWGFLALLGGIRVFLMLLVFGMAYLVLGNLAGRIVGVVLLLLLVVWVRALIRERRAERQAKTS